MKKTVTLFLVISIIIGVFSGVCLVAKADSPNLLEMYGLNPRFKNGVFPWQVESKNTLQHVTNDSSDGDGYCVKVSKRTQNFENLILITEAFDIIKEQGSGTYYYSFYVKCANKGDTCRLTPAIEMYHTGQDSQKKGSWISNSAGFTVTGDEWVKIEVEGDIELVKDGKDLTYIKMYSIQRDFSNNAVDLMFDDITLIKRGEYKHVDAAPSVDIPASPSYSELNIPTRTGIGAIYYHMWFETLDDWWLYDNSYATKYDRNSTQEARSLSPKQYHYRMPFFATLNTSVTKSNYIAGDLSAGVVEFPEFTEAIWKQEMEYAIEAGIDFMAYTWTQKGRAHNASAYTYHINSKGLDGKIKMCSIIQGSDQDIEVMANAMTEDYWYTIDGMPVVYIFSVDTAAANHIIEKIRYAYALAQYAKTGSVGNPVYVIRMGITDYSNAANESLLSPKRDALGWYAISTTKNDIVTTTTATGIKADKVPYTNITKNIMNKMENVLRAAKEGKIAVSPFISLGWDDTLRVDNPVTWFTVPARARFAAEPTQEEITTHVLEVLNWNKENREVLKSNTVLMYAWNEFTEGGWICPTAAVDENGNLLKNEDGTNKINRTHLDAVKKAIQIYREENDEEFNLNAGVNNGDISTDVTPDNNQNNAGTENSTNKPSNTDDAKKEDSDNDAVKNNGWVLWVSLGGAVVAVAATVAVIILKKKAVKKATEE